MARNAFVAEIQPDELGNLSFLAGMLVGMGRPEGQTLQDILGRVVMVEVDDDFGTIEQEADMESEGGTVVPFPEADEGEFEEITPETDPTAPENLGIALEQPNPIRVEDSVATPEEARPVTPGGFPVEFGAGPIPGGDLD